jgi:hypothetical protein
MTLPMNSKDVGRGGGGADGGIHPWTPMVRRGRWTAHTDAWGCEVCGGWWHYRRSVGRRYAPICNGETSRLREARP